MALLTTLADVRAWLSRGGPPGTAGALGTGDDELLTTLVAAASAHVEKWLGRPILSADWQETRDGTGGHAMQFAVWPVSAVISLVIDTIAVPPAPDSLSAGYSFGPTQISLRHYRFSRRTQNVSLVYTAGYSAVPSEVAQATTQLAARYYRERDRIGEVSKRIGGEVVSYSLADMSPSICAMLQPYRSVAPIGSGFPPQPAATQTDPAILAAAA